MNIMASAARALNLRNAENQSAPSAEAAGACSHRKRKAKASD